MWVEIMSSPGLQPDPHVLLGDDDTWQVGFRSGWRFPRSSLHCIVLHQSREYQKHEMAGEGLSGTQSLAW